MKIAARPQLHLLVSPHEVNADTDWLAAVAGAIDGGVNVVQLRNKHDDRGKIIAQGQQLRTLLREHGVPLVVNDSPELAETIAADGVHLGQTDQSPLQARQRLGEHAIIGYSVENAEQLQTRRRQCAASDYLGVGPVFATPSKPDAAPPVGLAVLAQIVAAARADALPVVAVGGVSSANVADVWRAGVAGVAVISAIARSPTPRDAARALLAPFFASEISEKESEHD
ncbi:MAG: thiamine phosphate synthase [Alphaproteobacteria bacterium]|nr:thiamine phosphate synthase [Alphaproteobacteria bacterium]